MRLLLKFGQWRELLVSLDKPVPITEATPEELLDTAAACLNTAARRLGEAHPMHWSLKTDAGRLWRWQGCLRAGREWSEGPGVPA